MKSITATLGFSALSLIAMASNPTIKYPVAPTSKTVDTYFGMSVPDPYRPLENDTAAATKKWVEEENKVTRSYLDAIPFRNNLRDQIAAYQNYTKYNLPVLGNDGKYYFYENDGLKNQAVLYRTDKIGGEAEVFIDPNTLSDNGTVALTGTSQSKDGRYTAYTISRNGSDWTEIYVMDTATKQLLPDHIEWAKFTNAEWAGDGFFYSAYPRPESGKEFSNSNENHRIYYHRIGTPQADDVLIYEDLEHPLFFHTAIVAGDEKLLFVSVGGNGVGNGLKVKPLDTPNADWTVIEPSQDYLFEVAKVKDGKIYYITSKDAPNKRVMTASVDDPTNMSVFIAEDPKAVLDAVSFTPDKMIVNYEQDASTHPYIYSLDGHRIDEIKLPTFGTASFSTSTKSPEVYYSFTSFLYPTSIFAYDVSTGQSTAVKTPDVNGFNPADYVTEQVFYPSVDGTMIPMFLTYKKGLERNSSNPVYLYGYGGFNISLPPSFSANRLVWLENGGIYAQANLRGGSEYGEQWHQQGTKQNKLNVFNDFIAAAEYMIKQGWTNPELITIEGGSNGGLLVGATVNLRPDLFKVAIPRVGVMDMMRYHLFTIGWNWAPDYGTSDDSEEMASYLLGYSPVHTIKSGPDVKYPAILVTTADHDDRVVPAHSFKYAATLQAAQTGDAPKLIRIDSNAGHGAGKPIAKVIDEQADIYSFIFNNIGITPKTK